MSKDLINDDRHLDDQLAEFADQVIDHQAREISTPEDAGFLRELQSIVLEIHNSVSPVSPDDKAAKRIHQNLIKTWRQDMGKGDQKETFTDRLTKIFSPGWTSWQSTSQRRRRVAVQIAFAVVIILAFMIPLTQTQEQLPGAATGETGLTAVIFILLIAGSLTVWYLWRRKK
jgi:hypothetical protein